MGGKCSTSLCKMTAVMLKQLLSDHQLEYPICQNFFIMKRIRECVYVSMIVMDDKSLISSAQID